jgi:hypothetical protein
LCDPRRLIRAIICEFSIACSNPPHPRLLRARSVFLAPPDNGGAFFVARHDLLSRRGNEWPAPPLAPYVLSINRSKSCRTTQPSGTILLALYSACLTSEDATARPRMPPRLGILTDAVSCAGRATYQCGCTPLIITLRGQAFVAGTSERKYGARLSARENALGPRPAFRRSARSCTAVRLSRGGCFIRARSSPIARATARC